MQTLDTQNQQEEERQRKKRKKDTSKQEMILLRNLCPSTWRNSCSLLFLFMPL